MNINRFALGTAQFGSPYGVANQLGQVGIDQVAEILRVATSVGVDTLDTAIAYGESEQVLGQVDVSSFKIVSKLPALSDESPDLQNQVIESVEGSLNRLKITQLYGLLLHRPGQLLSHRGKILYESLQELKDRGLVKKIGVSIYNPTELEALCRCFEFDLIQSPFNIFDCRLGRQGWLIRLKKRGVEIHVRSIFLQGLLLMNSTNRPKYFESWDFLFEKLEAWREAKKLTPLEGCLGTPFLNQNIDRVVAGVDSLAQFQQIIAALTDNLLPAPNYLCCDDTRLINPSQWNLK